MALATQFTSFFISPFGEKTVCDELNNFLKAHRIVNIEKRLIDGERGTGWVFLVEYGLENKNQAPVAAGAQRVDYREVLNDQEYALFDKLRYLRKEVAEKQGIPVYAVFTNEHLAGMVKKIPKTARDFLAFPGVGESRAKQYSGVFLKLFAEYAGSGDETAKPPV
jgi:superfamily II DNA helicase RecQ